MLPWENCYRSGCALLTESSKVYVVNVTREESPFGNVKSFVVVVLAQITAFEAVKAHLKENCYSAGNNHQVNSFQKWSTTFN